ncbi:MAG: amidohydrolase [Gemmatimonadetes bacterium]|nr:amidohydrolase [Gemmatimonadota bacterium]
MTTYAARWVLPISRAPIEHGAVAVEHGRITWVGSRAEAPAGDHVEDLGDAILMPGLVNTHTHLELTAMRGLLEDIGFRHWILRLTFSKRAVLDRESMLDAARLGIREGLLGGITTYADTCDSGVAFDAMLEAGVRGIMYQEVFGPDPAQCEPSFAELQEKVAALAPRVSARVRVGVSPHAPYTVSDALYARVARWAQEQRLPIAVHIAEGSAEQELVTSGRGEFADGLRKRGIECAPRARSPMELMQRTGVLAANPLLIHCVRLDATDIAMVAQSGAGIAHCPVSNAKLGHGIAPLMEMLAAGIAVGLGSDSMASNNRMDMLEESRVAILAQRMRTSRPDAPTAAGALELATLGGARALGLDVMVGSLEPGKCADLCAFSLSDSRSPSPDPVAAAVFALAGSSARLVCVDGIPLVEHGQLLRSDPGLAGRVNSTSQALRAWIAAHDPVTG